MAKAFIKTNKELFILSWGYAGSISLAATAINLILFKYYGYTEAELSIILNVYVLAFTIGTTYTNLHVSKRLSYVHAIIFLLSGSSIVYTLHTIIIETNLPHYFYILNRFMEGLFNGGIISITSHILKTKTIFNTNNGFIHSINSSAHFFIKLSIPLASTTLLIIPGFEASIYLFTSSILILLALYFYKSKNLFSNKYQKYMLIAKKRQKLTNQSIKESFVSILINLLNGDNKTYKSHYILSNLFHNSLRPFFDLYLGLLMISVYNYNLVETTFFASCVALGQSMQLFSGKIADRYFLYYYNLALISLFSLFFYTLAFEKQLFETPGIATILFFILGIGRSLYANYAYKITNNLIKLGMPVNHTSFLSFLLAGFSNYFAYLMLSWLLYNGFSLNDLVYIPILIIIGIIILSISIDRVCFKKNI
ncbi:MFS transporter [Methylomonas methanica]|uniref:MFS transporter n=1 Tax=Methylomonas methanica (strain DSM 25384 / MC09) TaxID=857087 RepID=F9ZYA1_METMM|nr:MFS transporter [Methylomonas methanica]AEG01006.1 hypothetical protein Metme_2618 [Methylomonas methanica MC09]